MRKAPDVEDKPKTMAPCQKQIDYGVCTLELTSRLTAQEPWIADLTTVFVRNSLVELLRVYSPPVYLLHDGVVHGTSFDLRVVVGVGRRHPGWMQQFLELKQAKNAF